MKNLFGNNLFQQETFKKTKSSEGSLNAANSLIKAKQETKPPTKKIGFDDFNNLFADMLPPKP